MRQDNLFTASRILIIDDQPSNVMLLEGILEEEDFTSFRSITDSREVLLQFVLIAGAQPLLHASRVIHHEIQQGTLLLLAPGQVLFALVG